MTLVAVTDAGPSHSIDDLTEVANRECTLTVQAARVSIEHAMNCGDALLAIRDQLPKGEWCRWLDSQFVGSKSAAHRFMRIAVYRDQIPDTVDSLMKADTYLRGLPRINGRVWRTDPKVVEKAITLYQRGGKTLDQVGEEFGVTASTVHSWVNRKDRLQNDAKAARAIEEMDVSRRVRDLGGAVSDGYSLVRRAAQMFDRALGDEDTRREHKADLRAALTALHEAEDAIKRLVGVVT